MANYSIETINEAKSLYLQGYSIRKIAEALNIPAHCTVDAWKTKYKWKEEKPEYPVVSLKAQLDRCTKIVNTLEPELEKVDVINPTPEGKQILANYKKFAELQLKLVKQLGSFDQLKSNTSKKNIFL